MSTTGSTTWQLGRASVALLILLPSCAIYFACRNRQTEDPNSVVVKLRNDLRRFAAGDIEELEGDTPPERSYVLLFGYQGPTDSLPVSEALQQKLERLTPRDYERYVLAEVMGDEITEYSVWSAGDIAQIYPVPLLIRGDPFRLIAVKREPYRVTVRLE